MKSHFIIIYITKNLKCFHVPGSNTKYVLNTSEIFLIAVGMPIYITVKTGEQDWTKNCNKGFPSESNIGEGSH